MEFFQFYPWIEVLEDRTGNVFLYDLFKRIMHLYNKNEFEDLLANLKKTSHSNEKIVNKSLNLGVGYISDEPLYSDSLRLGSKVTDRIPFKPAPQLRVLDIVPDIKCDYQKDCPISNENMILSFPCELCFGGKTCIQNENKELDYEFCENILSFVNSITPQTVSLPGTMFQKSLPNLHHRDVFIQGLQNNNNLKININTSQFHFDDVISMLKKSLSSHLFNINLILFFDSKTIAEDALAKLKRSGIESVCNVMLTFVFDFSDLEDMLKWINRHIAGFSYRFLLAPFLKQGNDYVFSTTNDAGFSSLALNWLPMAPDIEAYTTFIHESHIPCLTGSLLIDSNLAISNCKAYWNKKYRQPLQRRKMKEIISNWIRKSDDDCLSCGLRGACFGCKDFIDSLKSEYAFCPHAVFFPR
jgi:hypothetical protein